MDIHWLARCRDGIPYESYTIITPPFRRTPTSFIAKDSHLYRNSHNGERYHERLVIAGHRVDRFHWEGTFHATVRVRGSAQTLCRLRRARWFAHP
jgi:acetyl esterase/lipase